VKSYIVCTLLALLSLLAIICSCYAYYHLIKQNYDASIILSMSQQSLNDLFSPGLDNL
jgi:hypothetical protein